MEMVSKYLQELPVRAAMARAALQDVMGRTGLSTSSPKAASIIEPRGRGQGAAQAAMAVHSGSWPRSKPVMQQAMLGPAVERGGLLGLLGWAGPQAGTGDCQPRGDLPRLRLHLWALAAPPLTSRSCASIGT